MLHKLRQLLFLIIALPLLAFSMQLKTINVADVPVPNQSSQALQKALPDAFAQVLIKMTGNEGVMTLPSIQNALPNINGLLQSYSYHQRNMDNGQQQLMLRVVFDRNGLMQLLQSAGQPVWSSNRPLSLVWLTVNDGQQPAYVLSSSTNNVISSDVNMSAFRRGVPYLLPAMDLQDQSYINQTQSAFSVSDLQAAAKRYDVASVIAGNITKNAAGQWQGQWMLIANGQPMQWGNQGVSADAVIVAAMNNVANTFANRYAVIDNKNMQSGVSVTINGINDISDYAKIVGYFRSLAPVASVEVSDMQGSSLVLDVNTMGGQQALMNVLSSSAKLTAVTQANQLTYSWNEQTHNG